MKVGLYTLGCKVSSYETEAVAEEFERAGFEIAPFEDVCDVYVINTCTVTAESDAKSRKYIRRAIRKNSEGIVIVIGCYSQRAPSEVAAISGVSAVIGTADKLSAVKIAQKLLGEGDDVGAASTPENGPKGTSCGSEISGGEGTGKKSCGSEISGGECAGKKSCGSVISGGECADKQTGSPKKRGGCRVVNVGVLAGAKFEDMKISRAPRTRGYVKIEDGCDCKCTYCAISAARGPVRSKQPSDVLSEVKALYAGDTKEIVLTGIETGSYGRDLGCGVTLASLIEMLDREGACERIRLGSMAPELIGRDFIEQVAKTRIMVPHFHVSMQSGSNNVLKRMKRRYTRERALENIKRIKKYIPGCTFTADLMVGFPGESEEDFLDTVRFVKEAGLLDAHVFAYSKREGTEAAGMDDQIADEVKKERSARLIAAKNRMRDEVLSEIVELGKPLSTILESRVGGEFSGHSDSYVEVRVKCHGGVSGECVLVKPLYHKGGVIHGEIIT